MVKRLLAAFTANARTVILIMGLFNLANGLSGIFVNVYLWKVQHSLQAIAWYNLASWLAILLVVAPAAALAKRRGSARPLQLGLVGLGLFYGLLLYLQGEAGQHLFTLGALQGAAFGFYAIGYNLLSYEVSTDSNRDRFFNATGFLSTAANLTAPATAGLLIAGLGTLGGYRVVFGTSCTLFALAAALAIGLKSTTDGAPLELLPVLRRPDPGWRRVLGAHVLMGLREVYGFLMSLLIFVALGSEAALGQWSLLTGALSLAVYAALGRRIRPGTRLRWLLVGALGVLGATGVLAVSLAAWALLLHSVLGAIFSPLASTPFSSLMYAGMGEDGRQRRHEYIAAREFPLGLGRLLVGSLFLLLQPRLAQLGPHALGLFLVLMGSMHLAAWLVLRPLEPEAAASP